MFNSNRIRWKNLKKAFIVTTCFLFGFLMNANANALSGNLQKGNYDVGFKTFHTFDYSRAYKGKQGRPIQIAVWYPTTAKAPKMSFAAFSNPDLIRAPIMFMSARNLTPRVKSFIEKINYSNSFLLDFSEVAHNDFSSYNFIARNFAVSLTNSEKKKQRAYEIVCQYALRFFDAQLKGDKSGKELLEQDSADKDLLSLTRKTSLPLPPSQEEFFAIVREKGFEPAHKIYQEVKSRDANYQIFEAWEITVLADQLFKAGRADDALKSAQLRIEAYPNDYLSYEWLANLYYKQKDWNNALRHYETAYRMALKEKETQELLQELEWYRKRIEIVKKNLSEKTTEVKTN